MGTHRLGAAVTLAVCAALVVLTACGGKGQPTTSPDQPSDRPTTAEAAVAKYGPAAVKDPKTTYQSDVVFIDKGLEAIRSVSPSGLIWTLDPKAKGVSDLEIGKIMYASQFALGRVLDVREKGEDVQVVVAPVLLNEVVKDGVIKVDQGLDLSQATFNTYPDSPGVFTDQSGGEGEGEGASPEPTTPRSRELPERITLPAMQAAAKPAGVRPFRAKPKTTSGELTIGPWVMELMKESEDVITLKFQRAGTVNDMAVQGSGSLQLHWKDPHVRANMPISGGEVSSSSSFALEGLDQITGKWQFGGKENSRARIEIPVDVTLAQATIGALPVAAVLKVKVIIAFGITAKKTVMNGDISYQIHGPLRTGSMPNATTAGSFLDKVTSVAIGPWGLQVSAEFKLILGAGVPSLLGGVFGKVVFSVGVAGSGSMNIRDCTSGTVRMTGSVGYGVNISPEAMQDEKTKDIFDKLLTQRGKDLWEKIKAKLEVERTTWTSEDLVLAEDYLPKVPVCKPDA